MRDKVIRRNAEVQVSRWAAIGACLCVLLGGGVAHRWIDHLLLAADATPVRLEAPLSTLPAQIGHWRGTDVPMDKRVLEVAGCDDHVYRRYVEEGSRIVLDLYVAYAARPAKMLGHRPQVCYPAHGWTPAGTRADHVLLADGTRLDFLIHQFTRNERGGERIVVLNYYVLHGRRSIEWTDFWGPQWRGPNLSRDPNFYVAQVQVSCLLPDPVMAQRREEALKRFVAEVAPQVHAMLPRSTSAKGQ